MSFLFELPPEVFRELFSRSLVAKPCVRREMPPTPDRRQLASRQVTSSSSRYASKPASEVRTELRNCSNSAVHRLRIRELILRMRAKASFWIAGLGDRRLLVHWQRPEREPQSP